MTSPGASVLRTMRESELERFLLHVALPPIRLGLYVKRLEARRTDPAARMVAVDRAAARGTDPRASGAAGLVELKGRGVTVAVDVALANIGLDGFAYGRWRLKRTVRGGRASAPVAVEWRRSRKRTKLVDRFEPTF